MSIEQQLTQAYEKSAEKLNRPQELDLEVMRMYEAGGRNGNKKKNSPKHSLTIKIIVAAMLLTTLGFSSHFIFQLQDDLVDLIYHSSQSDKYDPILAQNVRSMIQKIRSELQVGDRYLYYTSELMNLLPKVNFTPYIIVTKPYVWENREEWKQELNASQADLRLPDDVLEPLTFIGGQKELPFGGYLFPTEIELLEQLKEQTKKLNEQEAWIKLSPSDSTREVYATFYENTDHERFQLLMEVFDDKTSQNLSTTFSTKQEVSLKGEQGYYIKSEQFLFSDFDHYQSLNWLDTQSDETVLYTLGSPDLTVTLDELIDIAEQIIH